MLRYTAAEVCGGALIAAWKFSNQEGAVDYFLSGLADACVTPEAHLIKCTNELLRYYQLCFPEAAKSYEDVFGDVFLPIPSEAAGTHEATRFEPKVPTATRVDSPDTVLAVDFGGGATRHADVAILCTDPVDSLDEIDAAPSVLGKRRHSTCVA